MRSLPGIPTLYMGRRYRSRLEARYAAFFDALDWSHEYEPFDLHGYVPDFMLHPNGVSPMLVEVKPFVPPFENEYVALTCARIIEGGWLGEALVVGAQHLVENQVVSASPTHVGLMHDGTLQLATRVETTGTTTVCIGRVRDGDDVWRPAYIAREKHAAYIDQHGDECNAPHWYVTHDASEAALSSTDFFALRLAWSEAGNKTQWKAPPTRRLATCRHGNELRDCQACDSGDRDR